jgi:hypothetical protein
MLLSTSVPFCKKLRQKEWLRKGIRTAIKMSPVGGIRYHVDVKSGSHQGSCLAQRLPSACGLDQSRFSPGHLLDICI